MREIKLLWNYINDNMDIQAKSDKVLTPEYLDWYSKLTDLPTTMSDKLCSKLYKIYKKMGLILG